MYKLFCLVCFDIVDDRARSRVAKFLKEYGVRVQKSVFELAGMNEKRFLKMKDRLEDSIDCSEDTIRYYTLCRACLNKVEITGIGIPPDDRDYRVI